MTRLPDRFVEYRALRDAACAVLTDDIERQRASLGEQGIASRVSSGVTSTISARIRTGARDVLDEARVQAGDHKGVLALLVGAIILWFARGPILDWIVDFVDDGFETGDVLQDAETPEAVSEGDPA